MPTEVKAPTIGESVSEIYIGEWHKAEGERVEQDEPLVELESDKATLDLPAPASGVLKKILKQPGDVAEVGEVLALIDEGGEAPEKPAAKDDERGSKKTQRRKTRREKTRTPFCQGSAATRRT
jgi:2-oxoglutarate dehydrogenase E2 component (dihydrolipoamide succinyltransferase)